MAVRPVLFILLLAASAVQAQLKPPADFGSPRPPAPPASAAATGEAPDPLTAAKEAAAAKAAGDWLKLIDAAEYGKAWDQSAPIFRERVPRQQWVEGLPKNRAEFGALKLRKLEGTAYKRNIPGAPEGEYVTVHFVSEFEKNPNGDEAVTMLLQSGDWKPVGYLLR